MLECKWLSRGLWARILAVGSDPNGRKLRLQLAAFLGPDATLGETECAQSPAHCHMSMIRDSEEVWAGHLVRSMNEWLVHRGAGDDDPVWRVEVNRIRPGDAIVIRQPDGMLHFIIAEVCGWPSPC